MDSYTKLKELNAEGVKEIETYTKLYDIAGVPKLTPDLEPNPAIKSFQCSQWNNNIKLFKVTGFYHNQMRTVALFILNDSYYFFFGKGSRMNTRSFSGVDTRDEGDVLPKGKVGLFVVCDLQEKSSTVIFMFDGTEEEIEWFRKILEKRNDYDDKSDKHDVLRYNTFFCDGIMTKSIADHLILKYYIEHRRNWWNNAYQKWQKAQNVKQYLNYKLNAGVLDISLKDTKGDEIKLRINPVPVNQSGDAESMIGTKDFWVELAQRLPKSQTFKADFINNLEHYLPKESTIEIEMNNLKAVLTSSTNKIGAVLSFFNGQPMAWDSRRDYLVKFFSGQPLPVNNKGLRTGKMSMEGQKFLDDGIKGSIEDLDGSFPVAFQVEYEKNKWYVTLGGKKFLVAGGLTTLKSLRTTLTGKGIVKNKESWYEKSNDISHIIERFQPIFGDETFWVIKQAKLMGKMISAMSGN